MNTKSLQSASAIFLGILALTCIFLPDEVLNNFKISGNEYVVLMIQILGALFFGLAIINWMSKTILIGGIYGKAIYMGNLAHFIVGFFAVAKWNLKYNFPSKIMILLMVVYLIFSILYGLIQFSNPKKLAE